MPMGECNCTDAFAIFYGSQRFNPNERRSFYKGAILVLEEVLSCHSKY